MSDAIVPPIVPPTPPAPAEPDAFFVLRACRELFQRRLVDIVRPAGVILPGVLDAFARAVGAAHDELAASAEKEGFRQTAGLTASHISLVGHDELELDIRIGHIAHQLRGNQRIDTWRVQLRYMNLLSRPLMPPDNNPLGLEPIRRGLAAICRHNGAGLEENLELLGEIGKALQARLADVYVELNALLEEHKIEPAAVQIVQRPSAQAGRAAPAGDGADAAGQGNNAPSNLLLAVHRQFAGEERYPVERAPSSGSGDAGAGAVALNASAMEMLNNLLERLCAIELRQLARLDSTGDGASEQFTLRALRAKDVDLPLGKAAVIAFDTLTLIFDGIFAAPDLPDVIKAAIGRLQIPLLKLAMLDAGFFSDKQHPARRLINAMARAAVGLGPDTGRDHPVCIRLWQVADAVRATLDTDDSDLSAPLAATEALIGERDDAVQAGAQPYLRLVVEHEAKLAMLARTHEWLRKTLAKTTRQELERFVTDYWLRVMQAAYRDGGTAGARWREGDATIELLLWSVQPQPSVEERRKLVTQIPLLIKRLNAGLDSLGISAQERAPFLNTCFELQTAALRKPVDSPEVAERKLAEQLIAPIPFIELRTPAVTAGPADHLLERDGKLVEYFGQPELAPSPWRDGVVWRDGDWMRCQLPDGERLCGRLCGQLSPSGTVVLFNAEWGYAVALSPALLEEQCADGRAGVVSDASLFDEAAERALAAMTPR